MKRKAYDWEAIEREYALGQKSIRVLSLEFGPGPSTICERAKRHGWVQDKTAEIKRKTNAALANTNNSPNTPTPEDIERAVKTNIEVVRQHRSLIKRTLEFADRLLKASEDAEATDLKIDNRVFLSITQGLAKAIPLERQAFNLDGYTPGDDVTGIKIEFVKANIGT